MTSVGDGGGLSFNGTASGVARVPTDSPKKIAAFQGHHRTMQDMRGDVKQ